MGSGFRDEYIYPSRLATIGSIHENGNCYIIIGELPFTIGRFVKLNGRVGMRQDSSIEISVGCSSKGFFNFHKLGWRNGGAYVMPRDSKSRKYIPVGPSTDFHNSIYFTISKYGKILKLETMGRVIDQIKFEPDFDSCVNFKVFYNHSTIENLEVCYCEPPFKIEPPYPGTADLPFELPLVSQSDSEPQPSTSGGEEAASILLQPKIEIKMEHPDPDDEN